MKNTTLLFALIAAASWGIWPVLARISKASPSYINITVSFFTFIGVVAFIYMKEHSFSSVSSTLSSGGSKAEIWLPIFAGLLNAVGIILYGYILSSQSAGIEVTRYSPVATGAIPAFTLIAGFILLKGESITWEKLVGIIAIMIGIYFLNKK